MAKDQTEVGITGKPIPKPRTAKQQYELEKKRRMQKHLGTNVGGTQYTSGAKYYVPSTSATNPRARTFEEFMSICEAKVPFARDAGNFRYSGKTGEEKALNKAGRLSQSQSAKDRQRANKIRKTAKTVADRDTAQARSDAMTTHYRAQQKRASSLAHKSMNKEELEIGEKFSMAANTSKPQSPKPTKLPKGREANVGKHDDWKDKPSTEWGDRPAAGKKLKSRANAVVGTQKRQDVETGVR